MAEEDLIGLNKKINKALGDVKALRSFYESQKGVTEHRGGEEVPLSPILVHEEYENKMASMLKKKGLSARREKKGEQVVFLFRPSSAYRWGEILQDYEKKLTGLRDKLMKGGPKVFSEVKKEFEKYESRAA